MDAEALGYKIASRAAHQPGEAASSSLRLLGTCRAGDAAVTAAAPPYLGHSPLETFSAPSNGMYC